MKGIAVYIAFFCGSLLFFGLFVECCDVTHHRGHMRTKNALIADGLGFEETTPQNLCHVLFAYGTGVFFHLATKDVGYVLK